MDKTTSGDGLVPVSASRRVYADLRQRIVGMQLRPGEKIVEREIAELHGTSRTPVHEAVQRLAEEGLIEIVQRFGTFVARIPLDQIHEAMLARTVLEVSVVERAAREIGPAGIERLAELIALQRASVAAGDDAAFHALDERFHETLAGIAHTPLFWRLVQQTKTQVDRYRRLTLGLPGRMQMVVEEHRAIADAVSGGDATSAARLMRDHLGRVAPSADLMSRSESGYFTDHLAKRSGG